MRAIGTAATASLLAAGLIAALVIEGCTSDDSGLMTDSRGDRGGDAAAGASGTGGTTGGGGVDGTGGMPGGTGGMPGGTGGMPGGTGGMPGTGDAGFPDLCQPNARCGAAAETCQTTCAFGYQFDCTCGAGEAPRWMCRRQRCGDDAGVAPQGSASTALPGKLSE